MKDGINVLKQTILNAMDSGEIRDASVHIACVIDENEDVIYEERDRKIDGVFCSVERAIDNSFTDNVIKVKVEGTVVTEYTCPAVYVICDENDEPQVDYTGQSNDVFNRMPSHLALKAIEEYDGKGNIKRSKFRKFIEETNRDYNKCKVYVLPLYSYIDSAGNVKRLVSFPPKKLLIKHKNKEYEIDEIEVVEAYLQKLIEIHDIPHTTVYLNDSKGMSIGSRSRRDIILAHYEELGKEIFDKAVMLWSRFPNLKSTHGFMLFEEFTQMQRGNMILFNEAVTNFKVIHATSKENSEKELTAGTDRGDWIKKIHAQEDKLIMELKEQRDEK